MFFVQFYFIKKTMNEWKTIDWQKKNKVRKFGDLILGELENFIILFFLPILLLESVVFVCAGQCYHDTIWIYIVSSCVLSILFIQIKKCFILKKAIITELWTNILILYSEIIFCWFRCEKLFIVFQEEKITPNQLQ